jgi:hypothetical protein
MIATRVQVLNEVALSDRPELCLQRVRYVWGHEDEPRRGYRFIRKHPDGKLQPARGQARIPSLKVAEALIALARAQGWGDDDGGWAER